MLTVILPASPLIKLNVKGIDAELAVPNGMVCPPVVAFTAQTTFEELFSDSLNIYPVDALMADG